LRRNTPPHKRHLKKKAGLPPGTIIYTGHEQERIPQITVIQYNQGIFDEFSADNVEEVKSHLKDELNSWINIDGIHNTEIIAQFEETFNIHSLQLEDIVNVHQRPKIEDFGHYLFFTLKMLTYNQDTKEVDSEQVSFIMGKNYLISFQEKPGDVFDSIRDRLRNMKGKVRHKGTDYLAFALIDVIVDYYFHIIESIGDEINALEELIFSNPDDKHLQDIQHNKKQLLLLRKSIYPLREAIYKLQKTEFSLIDKKTIKYFNDVYDHTVQIIETIESQRDMNTGLKDIYLSGLSMQMNRVMQVLTLIATIFIPLTFIVGIYGMNFEYMPELSWRYGYFIIMGLMLAIALGLLFYFKRKKWV
jgi:magnesium transporter